MVNHFKYLLGFSNSKPVTDSLAVRGGFDSSIEYENPQDSLG